MKNKTFLPGYSLTEVSLSPAADYDVICLNGAAACRFVSHRTFALIVLASPARKKNSYVMLTS
ncbi:hypothetical protein ACUTSW_21295 [Serratia sp. TSA_198.1]|jgi:hypothetical protein|uniref:hypothetical protein n=1 Tax=Serratia TaxID=613 RepID=UPI0007A07E79|nr:hypothetical protein [Serratia plymuthica]KYQ97582.1 hypothetical protein AWY96_03330 [Serratia plymuthica]MEE4407669.1 hypothetical protein [Serratia sp. C2(2)]MEE4445345.1 hypothetical protein [Serratia sp. C2(1)]